MESIHIFYSWQSDGDRKANQYFIRDALRSAIEKLTGDPDTDLELRLESDTEGKSGSPDIFNAIIEKIDRCNVFVADISIINPGATQDRKTPNPNVLLELGYAAHRLGWDRIICVFNENTGMFPGDLPFDLKGRRVTSYNYPGSGSKADKAKVQLQLVGTLRTAIRGIITGKLPVPITSLSEQQKIIRDRDVKTLHAIFERIDLDALDYLFRDGLHGHMHYAVIYHSEILELLVTSAGFHLYDVELVTRFFAFYESYIKSIGYGQSFFSTTSPFVYSFQVDDKPSRDAFEAFAKDVITARKSFTAFLKYVRENYLEIDTDRTTMVAHQRYMSDNKDVIELANQKRRQSRKSVKKK